MKTVILSLLLLGLAFAASSNFDYYVFSNRWTGTACMGHHDAEADKLPPGAYNFTVHGLWPSQVEGFGPFYCDDSYPFDMSEISDLKGEMQMIWPSLWGSAEGFYRHEWEKHGTCSMPITHDEHGYFKKGLELAKKLKLEQVLFNHGIVPSWNKKYDYFEIESLLQEHTGSKITFTCKTHSGAAYLNEVRVCMDKQFQPMDCPHLQSCYGQVYLPPISC
eukprot:gnl/Trimastix_PCT/245.p1 GENE.gnl/Trimastix_PCT/245~~gnl/Trimastix_PCT/245.p1  ORF type:complete len:219 (+),score=59.27 gnl/Trimastix_PCT/245:226-882(+)